MTTIEIINSELNQELTESTSRALLATTFKGLDKTVMKQAIMAGMIRGFKFKDFLEKNVYAIPYGQSYSLITSIDYARKIGMKNGIVGVSAPTYETEGDRIISCTVTVKRKIGEYVGEYTATVYFDEYTTKRNLWTTKPRTMLAKVAEMHALRKACPEELSQAYTEEEMQKEITPVPIDDKYQEEIESIVSIEDLKTYYIKNKGRGKEFDKAVTAHKKFLEQVKEDENSQTQH